jgi:transcriptional regulator of acetoin/glycerol metabolism
MKYLEEMDWNITDAAIEMEVDRGNFSRKIRQIGIDVVAERKKYAKTRV